jgi:hypothetical protein
MLRLQQKEASVQKTPVFVLLKRLHQVQDLAIFRQVCGEMFGAILK